MIPSLVTDAENSNFFGVPNDLEIKEAFFFLIWILLVFRVQMSLRLLFYQSCLNCVGADMVCSVQYFFRIGLLPEVPFVSSIDKFSPIVMENFLF